jgi:hypothetical protein
MEHTLRVTRAFHWQYFDLTSLDLPIPQFDSAYKFYEAYDSQEVLEPPGFYLVPKDNDSDLEPGWVPIKVRRPLTSLHLFLNPVQSNEHIHDLKVDEDESLTAGVRGFYLRNRLCQQASAHRNESPPPTDDDTDDSDPRAFVKTPLHSGFLECLHHTDFIDDEAIEVDEEEIAREEAAAYESESDEESEEDSEPEEEVTGQQGTPTALGVDELFSFLEQQDSGDPATPIFPVSLLIFSSYFLNSVLTGVRRGGRASKFPVSPKRPVVLFNPRTYHITFSWTIATWTSYFVYRAKLP